MGIKGKDCYLDYATGFVVEEWEQYFALNFERFTAECRIFTRKNLDKPRIRIDSIDTGLFKVKIGGGEKSYEEIDFDYTPSDNLEDFIMEIEESVSVILGRIQGAVMDFEFEE